MPLWRTTASKPKAIKVTYAGSQGVAAGWVACALDTVIFNYGGFGFASNRVTVNESGLYLLMGGAQWAAGNAHIVTFALNGAAPGSALMIEQEVPNMAFPPRGAASNVVELASGGTVDLALYNDVGVATVNAGTAFLYVQKLER